MVYLIHGSQKPLVDKQVKDIIKKALPDLNECAVNSYDLELTPLANVLDDVMTIPFNSDKKVIIARNAFFFVGKKDVKIENNYQELIDYIENQNDFSELILVVYEKIDSKNEIFKLLKKKESVIEVSDIKKDDWPRVVKKLFDNRNITITNDALNLFISKGGTDLTNIINEIDKLATYSSNLTAGDVKALVTSPLEDNIFNLTNALVDKEYAKALKVFKDLKIQSHEPIALLPIIANQMRFMYQVHYLNKQKLSEKQIVDELGAHPYRVSITLNKVRKIDEKVLLGVNNQLAELDKDIKSGLVDRFQGFELFIINQIKAGNYGSKN
jgi:DNA polymerase III subunit delta